MRLVSRPRALHIKNIQMPTPPEKVEGEYRDLRARIYGLHGAIVQIMFMKQCSKRHPLFSTARRSCTSAFSRVLCV